MTDLLNAITQVATRALNLRNARMETRASVVLSAVDTLLHTADVLQVYPSQPLLTDAQAMAENRNLF